MTNKTTCLFFFDNNPQKVYYVGQTLNGRIKLTLYKEKTVRGISITINGEAYCEWTEGSGEYEETYTGRENYLSEKNYILGDQYGEIKVAPGVYEYNFQCVLPLDLPTSVEGKRGHIRYSVLVCMDRPLWPDQEFEECFTVIKPLNLNNLSDLRNPIEQEKRKTFSYCCCLCCFQSKPIFIIGRLPVGGYTPGETIQLSVQFMNRSILDMYSFETILRKVITYHTFKDSYRSKQDIVTLHEQTISHGCQRNHNEEFLVKILIPAIPPTDTTTCDICKVEYQIEVKGHIPGCHSEPKLKIPVIIGTIPFNNGSAILTSQQSGTPYSNTEQSNLLMPIPMPMPTTITIPSETEGSNISGLNVTPNQQDSSSYDGEPPTFMEAFGDEVNIKGTSFAPMYPVYNFTNN